MRRSLVFLVNFSPIYMPAPSPSMETGVIVEWKKKVGELVKENDVFCTIQTDKAVVDFTNTFDAGYLAKIFRQNGETVTVASTIAAMVEDAADVSKLADYTPEDAKGSAAAAPAAAPEVSSASAPHKSSGNTARYGNSLEEAIAASGPGVMRIAAGLDKKALESISPTGRGGRFTKADLVGQPGFHYDEAAPAAAAAATSSAARGKGVASPAAKADTSTNVVVNAFPVYNFKVSDTTLLQQLLQSMPAPKVKSVKESK
uniref:Putative dihydrolipoamide acetyltransferase n=1 Tax=Trypanosoma congolense (strain IL3000) TaxID=1068625 RepID=G0UVM0_TRYCI|nr:putative dihydrolipoamide acetyltransferase [Trypanosoma congolense IL3000]